MEKSVYLDTTILSYLFDERDELKTYTEITFKWWQTQRGKYDIFLSEETLAELNYGDYPNKPKILDEALKIEVLPFNNIVKDVAQFYINNFLMPLKLEGDAFHLAYASVYKIDFLLTWNCNHLANANKKQHIRIINTKLGLSTPEVITPLELFEETENDYK